MPLDARRYVRKMRGGAQAHLLEAEDGNFYVVKFRNNPQHSRVLINESITSVFLRYLRISTPETAIIRLTPDFLECNPEVSINAGDRTVQVRPGWHFGSRYPGDPNTIAVYDFVPDTLLRQVVNLREFLGMLVLDKWTANADGRQSIFYRARLHAFSQGSASGPSCVGFVARMIDQGFAFNGPHWDFPDAPLLGLYHRPLVYEQIVSIDDFQPWLDQVTHFPEEVIDDAYKQVPLEWLDGEEDRLETLLEALLRRRRRVSGLLRECREARPSLFPNWK
jgi:hypothetical protein